MRRLFILLLLIAGLGACGKGEQFARVAPGQVVLAFGDSVTHGVGAGAGEDWPGLLAQTTGWRIENAGVPGDTAEAGMRRLAALLEQHRPALVLVEMGGNDFLKRRPQKAVKEDLRDIVRQARQSGAQVALVAVPELSLLSVVARTASDAPIYAELAKEEKIALIPDVFSDVLSNPELCSDQVHPNSRGYRQMATRIGEKLRQLGFI